MRDLHPDFANELSKGELMVTQLVTCEFEPEPAYFWGGLGELQYGGKTYQGLGRSARAQSIGEPGELQASSVELSVYLRKNDNDLGWLRQLRARGKLVTLQDAFLNPENLEVIATDTSFRGAAGEPQLRVGPRSYELVVTVANELEGLKRNWGLVHSAADQERLYPGDTSHRFIPFFQDINFRI